MCLDQVIEGTTEALDSGGKLVEELCRPLGLWVVICLPVIIAVDPVFFYEFNQGHQFENMAPNTLGDL